MVKHADGICAWAACYMPVGQLANDTMCATGCTSSERATTTRMGWLVYCCNCSLHSKRTSCVLLVIGNRSHAQRCPVVCFRIGDERAATTFHKDHVSATISSRLLVEWFMLGLPGLYFSAAVQPYMTECWPRLQPGGCHALAASGWTVGC